MAKRTGLRISVISVCLAISGGLAAGLEAASGAAASSARPAKLSALPVLRRIVDGTISVKTKTGYQTVAFARGTIESVSGSEVKVDSPDGTSLAASIGPHTRITISAGGNLGPGEKALLASVAGVAIAIRVHSRTLAPPAS
ncbi:MAG: hypothetical protein ACRDVP_07045 [Acidimicrobiales bacterium]